MPARCTLGASPTSCAAREIRAAATQSVNAMAANHGRANRQSLEDERGRDER